MPGEKDAASLRHKTLRKYIELKTSRVVDSERTQNSFTKYKVMKFWAQSFLLGVEKVVVGFRDDNGGDVSAYARRNT